MRAHVESGTRWQASTDVADLHAHSTGLLALQRQAGNAAVSRLLGSIKAQRQEIPQQDPKVTTQHRAKLNEIQGWRINELLPKLESLPADVKSDKVAGMASGGPRLVLAMATVAAKGAPWTDFVAAHNDELKSFYEDQVVVMVAFLGGPSDYTAHQQLPQWPDKFAKGDGPDGLPQAMRARVTRLALENRAALPVRPDLAAQKPRGFKYIGDTSAFQSSTVPRLEKVARKELMGEGGPTAVNTYDSNRPPLTLGAGFLQQNSVTWISAWLGRDETARVRFRQVGLDISGGAIHAMQDDGTLVDGASAMAVFAASPQLLSLFMDAGEAPASKPEVVKAQMDWIRAHHINDAAKEAEKNKWTDAAIAVCMHINHWLPAFGWGANKAAYMATGGVILSVVKVFGGLAGVAQTNGAIIVGNGDKNCTTPFAGSHFDAFGGGGDQPGVARDAALAAGTTVSLSLDEIAQSKDNAGFLFFQLGQPVSKHDQKVTWLRLSAQ